MTEILLGDAKVDKFRRTSIIKIVFDKLNLPENGGRIQFFYSNGEIVIRKITNNPVRVYADEQKIEIMEKDDIYRELIEEEHRYFDEELEKDDNYISYEKFKKKVENGEDVSKWAAKFYPYYRQSENRFIESDEMTPTEKEYDDKNKEQFDYIMEKVDEEYEKRKNKK